MNDDLFGIDITKKAILRSKDNQLHMKKSKPTISLLHEISKQTDDAIPKQINNQHAISSNTDININVSLDTKNNKIDYEKEL